MSKVKITEDLYEVHFDEATKVTPTMVCIRIGEEEFRFPRSQVDFREWSQILGVPVWLAVDRGIL